MWVRYDDLTLFGLRGARVSTCVDCGAMWVRETWHEDEP